jgi:CDP-diacylglycerol--serine O-phosphatidyltransferase
MRKVYILPNLFTSLSLFCGLLAIFEAMELDGRGSVVRAMHLLILAGVLDMMDGLVARLTRTQSSFGLNLDSLSDLVAFGAAPAVLAYYYMGPNPPLPARAACGLYVVCGALRLARYNVQALSEERTAFTGLPIPGGAAAVSSVIWVLALWPSIERVFPLQVVLPPMLLLTALLMVSTFPYVGVKGMGLWKRQRFEILVSVVAIIIMLFALKDYIEIIALVCFLSYLVTGPWKYFRDRRHFQSGEPTESTPEEDIRDDSHPSTASRP